MVGTQKNFRNVVDMCQPAVILTLVMSETQKQNPPAQVKVAELNKVASGYMVKVSGRDFGLYIGLDEHARYDALKGKYPAVVESLANVTEKVVGTTDAYREAVSTIHAADMKHEDSSFLMRAWGWGKDRVSMVHRIVDASPKVREAYLKGDFGFRKALTEARTEGELGGEAGGEGSRGGKRTGGKKGGTKAQRDALYAQAEVVARECKDWLKPGKLPIKSGPVRLGDWVVSIVATFKPQPAAEAK